MSSQRSRPRPPTRAGRRVGSQPTRSGPSQPAFDFRRFMSGNERQEPPTPVATQSGQLGHYLPPLPSLSMPPGPLDLHRQLRFPEGNIIEPGDERHANEHQQIGGTPHDTNQDPTVDIVTISETESIDSEDADGSESDIQEISDSESDVLLQDSASVGHEGTESAQRLTGRVGQQLPGAGPSEPHRNDTDAAQEITPANAIQEGIPQATSQVAPTLPQVNQDHDSDVETDNGESSEEEPMETDQVAPVPIAATISTEASNPTVPTNPAAAATIPTVPTIPTITSSQSNFKTPKKVSAAAAAARVKSPEKSDDEECCPICFESWTTSGAHRLVSLKCGHLFGQSCVDKWLRGQGDKCPQCNRKAKRSDIRVIYAKALKVIDTTARDQAVEALDKEKEARKKAEFEAADSRLRFQLVIEENKKLKQELDRKRQQIENLSSSLPSSSKSTNLHSNKEGSSQSNVKYLLDRSVEISKAGGCRVLTCSVHLGAIIISQPSGNTMFPGFGVKKLSTLDFRTTQFVHIHSKMIRDLAFNPKSADGLLLSCAMDKMLKITSVMSNTVVQSYEAPMPIWSCCWNSDSGYIVYAGLLNGQVLAFDTRKTDEVLETINAQGSNKPVVALQYVPRDVHADFRPGGLLVGQLDRTSFFEELASFQHKVHMLPLEGTLTSLCFEPNTRHILASFRPSAKIPNVRHVVCELVSTNASNDPTNVSNLCTCNTVQTLHGGSTMKMLSRSQLYTHPDHPEKLLVCAGDEATVSAKVWDASAGQLRQRLTSNGPVVNTCQFQCNDNSFLTTLTEKSLAIYKWT